MKKVDVVGAVLVNEKDEILCALRSQQMSLPGLWEFPGGKIEAGETPQDSLKREILEELKVEIEVGEQIEDTEHQYPNIKVHLRTFYGHIIQGEPQALEHERLEWVSRIDLSDLNWAAADLPTVAKLISLRH